MDFLTEIPELGRGDLRDFKKAIDWGGSGGAFYYRGMIDGEYLITAGLDASARDLLFDRDGKFRGTGIAGDRLVGHDRTRIFGGRHIGSIGGSAFALILGIYLLTNLPDPRNTAFWLMLGAGFLTLVTVPIAVAVLRPRVSVSS